MDRVRNFTIRPVRSLAAPGDQDTLLLTDAGHRSISFFPLISAFRRSLLRRTYWRLQSLILLAACETAVSKAADDRPPCIAQPSKRTFDAGCDQKTDDFAAVRRAFHRTSDNELMAFLFTARTVSRTFICTQHNFFYESPDAYSFWPASTRTGNKKFDGQICRIFD